MGNLTILVNSCDKYEDAWEPFFRLLKRFWPECSYEIVLVTENKKYHCDYLNVRTFCGGKKSWGMRLKSALESIESEHVLYFLEDFFLMKRVDENTFQQAFKLICNDPNIGFVGLKNNHAYYWKDGSPCHSSEPFLSKDEIKVFHRVNNMVGIWKREWFVKLIRTYETPWEFDNYASERSKKYPYKVLLINNEVLPEVFTYELDYEFGYGISHGKWLPKNKELFDKYDITVDFDKMGWLDMEMIWHKKQSSSPDKISLRGRAALTKKALRRFRSLHLPF